jgi:RNA polymerase sigma-70 factor (ECF subfamily)
MDNVAAMSPEMDASDESDALAAQSDPEAFARLFARHRVAVFRYLRARGIHEDDAGDLAASTFERAFVAIDRYRPGASGFLAWLFVIARHVAIDAHRRQASSSRSSLFQRPPDWGPGPEDLVIQDEVDRAVAAHVLALPPLYREVIVLRFAGGLSARQIGAVIGKSEAATHKLIGRALATLREAYRGDAD